MTQIVHVSIYAPQGELLGFIVGAIVFLVCTGYQIGYYFAKKDAKKETLNNFLKP